MSNSNGSNLISLLAANSYLTVILSYFADCNKIEMNMGLRPKPKVRPMIRPPSVGIVMRGQDKRNDDVTAGMIF